MDYIAAYNSLIGKRKQYQVIGYSEVHHIRPRALGGTDDKSNLVNLSAREHFIAHLLLAKIHGGAMWAAVAYMSRGGVKSAKGVSCSSRQYDTIKKNDSLWRSEKYSAENNPMYGKTHSSKALSKMRKPRTNKAGLYGRKIPGIGDVIASVISYRPFAVDLDLTVRNRIDSWFSSDESLIRLNSFLRKCEAQRNVNRDHSGANNPNFGNGIAIKGTKNPMYGRVHSSETKALISEKSKRTLECPHCGKLANIANAHRWHFDNCKNRK